MEITTQTETTTNLNQEKNVNEIELTAPGRLRVIKRNGKVVAVCVVISIFSKFFPKFFSKIYYPFKSFKYILEEVYVSAFTLTFFSVL